MIWVALVRAGTLISIAAAVMHYYDLRTCEIKPTRIYSSGEAARFLGISRRLVVEMIRNNEIQGKLVRGNYRIAGQSIIEYFN